MNLYLLRTSRGSYDDYTRLILGIYESHELATTAGEKFLVLKKLN